MEPYQKGLEAEEPTEHVWFHVPNPEAETWQDAYTPLNIVEMGPSGVKTFLEKGNLWSGRGEYTSLEDQLDQVRKMNEAARSKNVAESRESSVKRAMDKRRTLLKIPFLRVGIDLGKSKRGE